MNSADDFSPLRPDDPRSLGDFEVLERYQSDSSGSIFRATGEEGDVLIRSLDRRHIPTVEAAQVATRRTEQLATLEGVGIAAIKGFDWECATPWVAVEAGPGMSLGAHISAYGGFRSRDTATFALFSAEVLEALHTIGLIHGSVRPSSIRIKPGSPIAADAGLYAPVRDLLGTSAGSTVVDSAWMTPEQLLGAQVTSATDVYLWALLVLYAASGSNPFAAGDARTTITRIRSEIPLVGTVLDEPLASAVTAALAKDPASRPVMGEIVRMLGGASRVVAPDDYGGDVESPSTGADSSALAEGEVSASLEYTSTAGNGEVIESVADLEDILDPGDAVDLDETDLPASQAEQSGRLPRWLIWGVVVAVVLGIAAGVLFGRLIAAASLPLAFPQPASIYGIGVAWGATESGGV